MSLKVFLFTVLLTLVLISPVYAQNKFKPLIERIALLQVYLEYLKQGYSIARNGLESVRKITKGEFDLHADYFNSLEAVNPEIKKYARIAGIISTQVRIVKSYKEAYKYAKNCGQFTEKEIDYLLRVYEKLIDEAAKDVELLSVIVVNGKVKMKDSERLSWIDRLYEEIQVKEKFLYRFNTEMYGVADGRIRDKQDVEVLKGIYQH